MRASRAERRAAAQRRPMYARVLGLRHLELSALVCFLLFEGSLTLAALLALAEVASWWTVLALPATVAAMAKLNDVVAGSLPIRLRTPVRAVAPVARLAVRPVVGRARVVPAQVYRAGVPAGAVYVAASAVLPSAWLPAAEAVGPAAAAVGSLGNVVGPAADAADAAGTAAAVVGRVPVGEAATGSRFGLPQAASGPADGARHRVGRQRGARSQQEIIGKAARHSASRRYAR